MVGTMGSFAFNSSATMAPTRVGLGGLLGPGPGPDIHFDTVDVIKLMTEVVKYLSFITYVISLNKIIVILLVHNSYPIML